MIHWNCSQQQKVWMKMELEAMGLWPGSPPVRHLTNSVSLWRLPPQPELIETACGLPSPKYFQLHPFFIWKPENDSIMGRLRNNYVLPCLHSCSRPQITSSGVGRPRVVVGIVNQYYLFASRLCCKACKRNWFADNPLWLAKLPKRYTNMLPALLTYKKAICKSVVDELRRTAKSPNDMANQLMEMMHLKYERANLAYLLSVQNIKDAEAGLYGQSTISKYLRRDSTPAAFGGYEDTDGWCGMSVSSYYLTDCLLQEKFIEKCQPSATQLPPTVRFPDSAAPATEALKRESTEEPQMDIDLPCTPPLPMTASPRSARTGPIKTGGRVFVLDHNRWPGPMRVAIDGLLARHHGQKDMLKLVDFDYASMVQSSCADPNSLLHPTTKHHIGRYIKHLAKLKNTSSSLNTSPEKLLETQQLWQHLTMGSDTTCVPVTALPPAVVNPPALPTQNAPLTEAAIEKIVLGLMEKQQQSEQQQQQKKKMTKTCLSCGQPKSRYMNDGSSIHYFYQSGHVRYFYCSTKVFKTYGAEGLTNPKMSFEDFMSTPFFQQELESIKQKVEQQKDKQKRKSADVVPSGRLCRFCHLELKQGPNSPHIHTGFPGVAGKYIYCPAKLFSLYQAKGMEKEMTWKEFQASAFYHDEKKRWMDEKRKC
ncbi:hypothetical protein J4Q44_G00112700 [Coregonus suidteri]|uniref:DUF6729 domain-containing protein n=1 Tax=Coregonus suidteri TaxID=861788 RepID=A0AAN8LYH4_9TELE